MALYDFECKDPSCGHEEVYDIPMSKYASKDFSTPKCSVCGSEMKRVIRYLPPVHFKGLGFYCTDKEYEKQLKMAEDIADNVYKKRAEKSVKEDPISQDDDFWQELCSQDFAKEHKERQYFTPSGPPSTVILENEYKASTTIAKAGTPTKWVDEKKKKSTD